VCEREREREKKSGESERKRKTNIKYGQYPIVVDKFLFPNLPFTRIDFQSSLRTFNETNFQPGGYAPVGHHVQIQLGMFPNAVEQRQRLQHQLILPQIVPAFEQHLVLQTGTTGTTGTTGPTGTTGTTGTTTPGSNHREVFE
jgi:hypothetical protein